LARAILARGPWLLLDEPIEELDDATAALVIDRLSAWLEQTGAGLILVSHRTPPVQLAGEIMTIDDLHVVNFGQLS
jgi:ATP-binding cassette subfamily C protein CydC